MKFKLIVFLTFFILYSYSLLAQDDQLDELNFEEQNYDELQDEAKGYFVIGGGFIVNMNYIDYSKINAIIKDNNFDLGKDINLKGQLYQLGAQGIISIGLIPNVRIGIIGMSGTKSLQNPIETYVINGTDSVSVKRNFNYSTGFTGINIDYAYVPYKNIAIVPGATFGWGTISMESNQTQKKEPVIGDFKPGNNQINYYTKLETSYWYLCPMLNIEYRPTILSMFRISAGYSLSLGQSWYLNGNPDAILSKDENKKVPTEIGSNGLTIQFGLLFGLFNY